ncbi:hypothetical protein [Phaeovulum sp.]|uniref:hypothetical protein n=1 Tax=Phaeovulum sp. TaxID=2934796 RepID=UPI0039E29576
MWTEPLADAAAVSVETGRADALRKWLLERWHHPYTMMRDLGRRGPNALRKAPKAKPALGILEGHGWIVALAPGTLVRGAACKQSWRIVSVKPISTLRLHSTTSSRHTA